MLMPFQKSSSNSTTREESRPNWSDVIKNSEQIATEPIRKYMLNTVKNHLSEDGQVRRYTFGINDSKRKNRTIIMVGQTGTGKSTLINMMLNYMLGVKWEDNIRFEIIPDEGKQAQTESQTTAITAYEIFGTEETHLPFSLTVIDTPGYGDTRGLETDRTIAQNLYKLLSSFSGVQQIDAACLILKASQNRLDSSQKYIFDAILSNFGKNMKENILTLITFSDWMPPSNALQAVIKSGVPYPKDKNNKPVHFLFNNRLFDPDESYARVQKMNWDNGTESLCEFFKALDQMKTQSMRMTENVIKERQRLEALIPSLESQIKHVDMKHETLEDKKKTLESRKEDMRKKNNFQYKYEVVVKTMESIAKYATTCSVCEENCHYPGCWWVWDLSWCSAMKDNKCTVCTNKCSYTVHQKTDKIYVSKKEQRTGTFEELKKDAEGKIITAEQAMTNLVQEVKEAEAQKTRLIEQCYQAILQLRTHALKFNSDSTRQNILNLIKMLKKNKDTEKVETLQKMLEKTE